MEHQKKAVLRGRESNLYLAWEIGTGKSCATIKIIDEKSDKNLQRVLILCPQIVIDNWKNEFKKFSNQYKTEDITCLTGPVKNRAEKIDKMHGYAHVFVTNYDALNSQLFRQAVSIWHPQILVCDEAHYLKNHRSTRATGAYRIAKQACWVYMLSGTPILNNAMDLFMQYKIMNARNPTLGDNFFAFRNRFFIDSNASWSHMAKHFPKYSLAPGAEKEIRELIAPYTMVVKKSECLDLPDLVTMDKEVPLGRDQKRWYNDMRKYFLAFVKDEAVTANQAITKALRMQQIISGFVKTDQDEIVRCEQNPRIEVLKELLEQLTPKHKVIVWACFRENYKQIAEVCNELGLDHVEIHGSVGQQDRKDAIERFENDSKVRVLIGNQGAGGLGINLVSASYAIWYSRGFKLGDDIQSRGRNYRKGSERHKKITHINLIAKETVDEVIDSALKAKLGISNSLIDYIRRNL